jgi:hypothetical protein
VFISGISGGHEMVVAVVRFLWWPRKRSGGCWLVVVVMCHW